MKDLCSPSSLFLLVSAGQLVQKPDPLFGRQHFVDGEKKTLATQRTGNSQYALGAHINLAQHAAIADPFEERQPLLGWRIAVARDPSNASQPWQRQQTIQVYYLSLSISYFSVLRMQGERARAGP